MVTTKITPESSTDPENLLATALPTCQLVSLHVDKERKVVASGEEVMASEVIHHQSTGYGSICFVVRRPGCGLCREIGLTLQMLATLPSRPLQGFGLFGIVKETGRDDAGLCDFQSDFFPYPLYRDDGLNFFKAFGNRKIQVRLCNPFSDSCRPLLAWTEWTKMMKRLKKKRISMNFKGECLVQGGIVVFDEQGRVKYSWEENTGQELHVENILVAVETMKRARKLGP